MRFSSRTAATINTECQLDLLKSVKETWRIRCRVYDWHDSLIDCMQVTDPGLSAMCLHSGKFPKILPYQCLSPLPYQLTPRLTFLLPWPSCSKPLAMDKVSWVYYSPISSHGIGFQVVVYQGLCLHLSVSPVPYIDNFQSRWVIINPRRLSWMSGCFL